MENKKKITVTVPVIYKLWGTIDIEVEEGTDIIGLLKDKEFVENDIPLPSPFDTDYIENSMEVDFETLANYLDIEKVTI